MIWDDYRSEMDALPISGDFEARTCDLLHRHQQTVAKERTMKLSMFGKVAAAVAATFALTTTAWAATTLMTPAQVADDAAAPALAESFSQQEPAPARTQHVGPYTVTLEGVTSGEGLTEWGWDGSTDVTYAVLAVQRTDGEPLAWDTPDPDSDEPLEAAVAYGLDQVTPLVGGTNPEEVNGYTLGTAMETFQKDGTVYYLVATKELVPYAGQKTYLAFYFGDYPENSLFNTGEDGSLAFADTMDAPHALFELPLM